MDGPQLPPAENPIDRAIQALCDKDPEMNAYAVEIFLHLAREPSFAHQVAPMLVREACFRHKRPDDCIRILDVVQQIGRPLEPDAFMELMAFANLSTERVAGKAMEVIDYLKDVRLADAERSVEEVA